MAILLKIIIFIKDKRMVFMTIFHLRKHAMQEFGIT